MTVLDIRRYIGDVARNAGEEVYRAATKDRAAFFLFSDFLEVTRLVKASATVIFDASSNDADFSALGISFGLPGRIERVRVDEDGNYTDVTNDLIITDAGTVQGWLNSDDSTDAPTTMAFTDSVTATFYPVPSDDGTLTVVYCPLQTAWQFGTRGPYDAAVTYQMGDLVSSGGIIYLALTDNNTGNTPSSSTTNWESQGSGTLVAPSAITAQIPDSLVGQILEYGAFPALQRKDPAHMAITGAEWEGYKRWRDSKIGTGSISGNVSFRDSLRTRSVW